MEVQLLGLLSMVLLIHGQNINEPELLVPNYDNAEHRVKGFEIRHPLVLHCNVTKEVDFKLIWEKDNKEVSKVDALQGRYVIIDVENKFIIERTVESDAGHYSCRLNTTRKEFQAVANLYVLTPSNIGVSEGENLLISCEVAGTKPKLYWQVGNQTIYNSTDKYTLKENEHGDDNGILILRNVSLSDRGEYRCLARNILTDLNIIGAASDVTYVRVKDKYASVWPAIGIVIELVILCATTIILGKCGKKPDLDEEDDE